MLEISDKDYRELQRIAKLRKAGVISKRELHKLTDEILAPLRKAEEKAQLRKESRQKLRDIDAAHSKRRSFLVQGGLPSLGKRK